MNTRILVSIASLLLCAGCSDSAARKEIAELKAQLYHRTFEFEDPKVEIVILSREIIPAIDQYGSPTFRVTGIIRQLGEFGHVEYNVYGGLRLLKLVKGEETLTFKTTIKNGNGAFTAETLFRWKDGELPDAKQVAVDLRDFYWDVSKDWSKTVSVKVQ